MWLDELRARWEGQLSHRGNCVRCAGGAVWHCGVRLRKTTLLHDGRPFFFADVLERKLRCRACGTRWTHAPDGISSRAHYQPCVVSSALERMAQEHETTAAEIAAAHGCHRRTLGRWIDRVAAIAEPAQLAAAIVAEADAPVLPDLPTEVRRPGGAHAHTRLLRALVVLALLEALASLRGLEPPALAHAAALATVMRVPANAPGPRSRGDPGLRR